MRKIVFGFFAIGLIAILVSRSGPAQDQKDIEGIERTWTVVEYKVKGGPYDQAEVGYWRWKWVFHQPDSRGSGELRWQGYVPHVGLSRDFVPAEYVIPPPNTRATLGHPGKIDFIWKPWSSPTPLIRRAIFAFDHNELDLNIPLHPASHPGTNSDEGRPSDFEDLTESVYLRLRLANTE
jgi:hypothetical protein